MDRQGPAGHHGAYRPRHCRVRALCLPCSTLWSCAPFGRDREKGTTTEKGQVICGRPHGESGRFRLSSWIPSSLPELPITCSGRDRGGVVLGRTLGWPRNPSSLPHTAHWKILAQVSGMPSQLLSASWGRACAYSHSCHYRESCQDICLNLMVGPRVGAALMAVAVTAGSPTTTFASTSWQWCLTAGSSMRPGFTC